MKTGIKGKDFGQTYEESKIPLSNIDESVQQGHGHMDLKHTSGNCWDWCLLVFVCWVLLGMK